MKTFYEKYKPVIIFYLLACLFSWPFFLWRDVFSDSWNNLNIHYIIKISLIMWGPGLSAIICSFIFKDRIKKTTTFFGTSVIKSLLFWGVPMAMFLLFGFKGYEGSYSSFAINMAGTFIFTLGEELGWRGFLQDQLNHLPKWKRYLSIGTMWELWHFTTRTLSGNMIARILRPLIFIIPNSALSWILGEGVNKSKSIIVAVTLHSWINILIEFGNTNTYIIFGLSVPFWCFMLLKWNKNEIVNENTL